MDNPIANVRETISRWAGSTQEFLGGLTRLLDAHEQVVAEAQSLEARVREAERRAQDGDQRSAKLTQNVAAMQQQLGELGRERSRLETALAQATAQAQTLERQAARPAMPPPSVVTRERRAIERIRLAPDIATAAASSAASAAPAAAAPAAAEPAAPGGRLVSPRAATGPRRPHTIRFSAAMLDEPGTAAGTASGTAS